MSGCAITSSIWGMTAFSPFSRSRRAKSQPVIGTPSARCSIVPLSSRPSGSGRSRRLRSRRIEYIGPIPQLPGLLGIYFYDPNGIRLEFACQPEDGETPAVIPCITQTKAEARAELETLPSVTYEWIEERLAALPG